MALETETLENKDRVRNNILNKIDDLREKILNNEPCPEQELNLDILIDISDKLEESLGFWYY
jgi:hypothetical protein